MQQFLQHNLVWIFGAWFLLFVVAGARSWFLYKKHRIIFPPVSDQTVLFDESSASGCSHKTLFTKFGGARNCLRVTVTDTEVWIRTGGFPFDLLAWRLDLEHRIPKSSVLTVQQRGPGLHSLLLDYRDERGEQRRFSLLLRRPEDFRVALALHPHAA